jgi:predicted Zn-dependent peptidase
MLNSPKLAILQSLDAMDKVQMEDVLKYIRNILQQPVRNPDAGAFKKEAMKEIRQALRQEKKRRLRVAV